MMREYEIVFWVALNSQKDIEGIILKNARSTDPETKIISAIRSRLILTAYTTKCELSDKKLPMNAISNIKQTIYSYSKRIFVLNYESCMMS